MSKKKGLLYTSASTLWLLFLPLATITKIAASESLEEDCIDIEEEIEVNIEKFEKDNITN